MRCRICEEEMRKRPEPTRVYNDGEGVTLIVTVRERGNVPEMCEVCFLETVAAMAEYQRDCLKEGKDGD